jgi:ribosomal protein S18 acetylase RimI-like enzyme
VENVPITKTSDPSARVASGATETLEADLANAQHAEAIAGLIDAYARGPGGQTAPLSAQARADLSRGLREHPSAFVLLAFDDGDAVGCAVCVWGFSTFAGRPFVNLHDFAVSPSHQGRGVGSQLLAELERRARERDCCKITLEVHRSNEGAKRLYRRTGFGPWEDPTLFVSKPLT